ncbi:MAG: LuxR C-terminal-related transcriptional regulator [Gammaproteobacteria bacterium]
MARTSSAIRAIAREGLDTEAMVITVFGDERHVVDALAAGAGGYLLKDDSYTDIGESIRQLLAGGAPISPAIARHLLKRFQPPSHSQSQSPPLAPPPAQNPAQPRTQPHAQLQAQSPLPERLTNREQEILKSIAKGYTAKEIAELEGVTYYTVTTHVKNIYRKLAVNSRTEAIFEAIQLGLIQPQSPTR